MFAEDFGAFLDSVDFAVDAIYDGVTAAQVIFDAVYLEALGVAGAGPVALGRADVFPAAAVGLTLKIADVTYIIRNRQPQDDGAFVLLQLEHAG